MRAAAGLLVFTLPSTAAATITKGPWVQRVTSSSAVVRVEVEPPGPVTVDLGLGVASDAGNRTIVSSAVRSLHTIPLHDLQPGRRYAYSVQSGATSKFGAFVAAPSDDADAPFRFLVFGDNRSDDSAHAAVVRAMVPVASDFVVHTGDFVENGASPAQWQTFFEIESPLLAARCLFSCVGNHELTDGAGIEYARFFGPTDLPTDGSQPKGVQVATKPEHLDGTFRWGNTRFFLLNGMVSFKGTIDRTWLEKALADSDAEPGIRWRIAVVHHGPWSSGPHGGNARLHDAGVPALLKAHKIDLIISGHDHIYERGWGAGMAYVVSGGGGAPVYKTRTQIPEAKKVESVRHFLEIGVSPMALQLVATRSDGSTIERCGLPKSAGSWDCDGSAVASAAAAASSEATGASTGAAAASSTATKPESTSRCSCDAVGTGSGRREAMLATLGAAVLLVSRHRRRSVSRTAED